MPSHKRMSPRQSEDDVWDFRWVDSLREVEATENERQTEALKTRVLSLRATLFATRQDIQKGISTDKIIKRIDAELHRPEPEVANVSSPERLQ